MSENMNDLGGTMPKRGRAGAAPALVAFGCLVAVVAACRDDTATTVVTAASAAASAQAPEERHPPPLPDSDIARATQRHFQDERLLRSEHVQVAVTQGTATLSGSVGNLLAKQRAVSVTETIKGIRAVVDQIKVTPVARTDGQLKSDVTTALQLDPATRAYAVDVTANDGRVTLSGAADSWQLKELVGDVAKMVEGVKAVDNTMILRYGQPRSEEEIATEVRHRISDDAWLDADVLGVGVSGHTVYLSGVVSTVAQRSRAHLDAWVAGVDAVDVGAIVVDWFAQVDQRRLTDYPVKSDADVAEAVRDAFRLDPRLKTLAPQVAVHNGTALLSGSVDGAKARRAAEADARDTVGVWRVRDEAIAQPGPVPTDTDVELGANRMLALDLLFLPEGKPIHVSSVKGKVALTGNVSSAFARFDAIADVEAVPGVAEVEDNLTVVLPPVEVRDAIEDRLFWDPRVQRDRVTVAVAPGGVANLTGSLDVWSEIKAAGEDARWGGASRVVNMIKLKKHPEVIAD